MELFPAPNSINLKVAINAKDNIRVELFRKDNKCGIREVHWQIGVFFQELTTTPKGRYVQRHYHHAATQDEVKACESPARDSGQ